MVDESIWPVARTTSGEQAAGTSVWTTDNVPPGQRLEYWMKAVSETFFELTTSTNAAQDFSCRLEAASVDGMPVALAGGSRQVSFRTRKLVNLSSEYSYHLIGDFSKAWVLAWNGDRVRMSPGDLSLVDSRFVFGGYFADACQVISLKLRPEWLLGWVRDPAALLGRRIERLQGWGSALSAFVAQMKPQVIASAAMPQRVIADNVGALLSMVESEMEPPDRRVNGTATRRNVARVLDILRQRVGEPELDATAVAASLRVPVETVHAWLMHSGMTFGSILQRERVAMASDMLTSRQHDAMSLAEIGRRVGIVKPSQFTQLLRLHLGESPSKHRQSSRADPSHEP